MTIISATMALARSSNWRRHNVDELWKWHCLPRRCEKRHLATEWGRSLPLSLGPSIYDIRTEGGREGWPKRDNSTDRLCAFRLPWLCECDSEKGGWFCWQNYVTHHSVSKTFVFCHQNNFILSAKQIYFADRWRAKQDMSDSITTPAAYLISDFDFEPNWSPWPICYLKALLSELELSSFIWKTAISHHFTHQ